MNIEEYRNRNKKRNTSYTSSLIKRTIAVILIIGITITATKYSSNIKLWIEENVLKSSLSFSKVNTFYQKYIGVFLEENTDEEETVLVSGTTHFEYMNAEEYLDGVKLTVTDNYIVENLEGGIVVYIGEKEGYGNTVIIQQSNGIDVWYGNVSDESVKIYDYINKDEIIAVANSELYLVFMSDGEKLDYNEYIK